MTFPWPWPKVTAVASISQNVLFCTIKSENHSSDHYKTWQHCCPSHGDYLIRFWRNSVENCYFWCVFSRSNTILAISQEWLVRLMWNEKEVHWLDTGYNMWPWPLTSLMTLTLDVSRPNFEMALSAELLVCWCLMKRKWVNMILGQLYDLALWPHPWPWPWSFKVRVWNSFISGMGQPIDNDRKGWESSIHDHDINLCDHGGVGGCTG